MGMKRAIVACQEGNALSHSSNSYHHPGGTMVSRKKKKGYRNAGSIDPRHKKKQGNKNPNPRHSDPSAPTQKHQAEHAEPDESRHLENDPSRRPCLEKIHADVDRHRSDIGP